MHFLWCSSSIWFRSRTPRKELSKQDGVSFFVEYNCFFGFFMLIKRSDLIIYLRVTLFRNILEAMKDRVTTKSPLNIIWAIIYDLWSTKTLHKPYSLHEDDPWDPVWNLNVRGDTVSWNRPKCLRKHDRVIFTVTTMDLVIHFILCIFWYYHNSTRELLRRERTRALRLTTCTHYLLPVPPFPSLHY